MKVDIYSKQLCPYCVQAKKLFDSKDIEYNEYIVPTDATKLTIQERVNQTKDGYLVSTVPQIFIDDAHIGGYDDLVKHFS